MDFLRRCRKSDKMLSFKKKWTKTILVLILGIIISLIATWSKGVVDDGSTINHFVTSIDLSGFMTRISFFAIIITMIAIDASSPLRALLNVAVFMLGVFAGYYVYTAFILNEVINLDYNLFITFTVTASVLSMLLWYAKGEGWLAVLLSSLLIGFFFRESFDYGIWFIKMTYIPELIIWIFSMIILYKNVSVFTITLFYSLVFAILLELGLPYIGL